MATANVTGKVVEISPEGNLVTDISAEQLQLAPRDTSVLIRCDEHETNGIFGPDHNEPPFTFLAVLAPTGRLELVIVGESARMMLGIRPGTPVQVRW